MLLNKFQIKTIFLSLVILVLSPSINKIFAVNRELCMPCFAGDGGQFRVGGNTYYGVIAGHNTQCHADKGVDCWYISTAGQYNTTCQCPVVSDGGDPDPSGGGCGEPAWWETGRCSTFKPDWFNPLACPTKNICTEFQDPDVRCGGTATICDGQYSATCGSQCDVGCPARTQCGMCGNPSCCTVTAPGTPVLVSPTNTFSFTKASSTVLDWNDVAWGTDCNNAANYYSVQITNGSTTTVSPAVSNYTYALGSCNSNVSWRVAAYNGAAWSPWSGSYTFRNTGFTGPTTTISSTSTAVAYPGTISFTANATDPDSNLSWISLRIDRINGYGTGTTSMTTMPSSSSSVCSGSSCSTTLSWSVPNDTYRGYYYAAYAVAADSCGYNSALSTPHIFQVTPTYNLIIDVKKTPLVLPDSNGNIDYASVCSGANSPFPNVNVTYTAADGVTTRSAVSDSSGRVTFGSIPESHVPITLSASPVNVQSCEKYGFYCINNAEQSTMQPIYFTGTPVGGNKNITISLGEEKKDSWETVFDGDIYAKNANIAVSCSAASVGGGFAPTTLVETNVGGFFRTAGDINADNTDDIYTGSNSGFAKNLNGASVDSGKSYDVWFRNFTFPDTSSLPSISNLAGIEANKVYKSGNLNISGNYNLGSSNNTSVVYVDGDLVISGNVTSSNGLVLFVVSGDVTVSSSVGVSNYTVGSNFTTTTPANITAGIISLGSVVFPSNGSASGDIPVIIDGFVMGRGLISFNRDLLENNDIYPAHIIKFNQKSLALLSELEDTIKTGLATYDVQWIYDAN